MPPAERGFVLPIVLGITLIAVLLAAHAMSELGTATLLSSQRLLQQRAFEAAESGLIAVLPRLGTPSAPPGTQILRSAESPTDFATVHVRQLATPSPPPGFSASRILQIDHEIRSSGHSARHTAVTVVIGARQFRAALP